MAFAINLSQFAYSKKVPRLRTSACRDKRNELEARTKLPPILVNAPLAGGAHETGLRTPTGDGCKCSVIPETPTREWPPCSIGKTSKKAEMAPGRKKRRTRFASSSEEEEEGRMNAESRDSVSLFRNTFACKRRKRIFKGEEQEEEEEAKREVVKEEEKEEGKSSREGGDRDVASKRPDQPQLWHSECRGVPKKEENQSRDSEGDNPDHIEQNYTDSEREEETEKKNGIRRFFSVTSHPSRRNRTRLSKCKRTKYPSLVVQPDGGWHSRRGGGLRTVVPGVCEREVGRLRGLFPQHDVGHLRKKLRESDSLEETVANILTSEGTVNVKKSFQNNLPFERHLLFRSFYVFTSFTIYYSRILFHCIQAIYHSEH